MGKGGFASLNAVLNNAWSAEGADDRAFLLAGGLCVLTAGAVLFIGRGRASRTQATPAAAPPQAEAAGAAAM